MKKLSLVLAAVAATCLACSQKQPAAQVEADAEEVQAVTIDHRMESLDGGTVDLSTYRGKALLIVNTASECGYTPQYEGLEKLHQRYGERGLVVIGVPSNDFGGQEPGSAEEIKNFCETRFGVSFPMLAKVHAKGPDMAPLYRTLTTETQEGIRGEVKWNFTKFLIDPDGRPVARFEPKVEPLAPELVAAVEQVLPR